MEWTCDWPVAVKRPAMLDREWSIRFEQAAVRPGGETRAPSMLMASNVTARTKVVVTTGVLPVPF
jgi:hypothetical protein